jgi:murein DD-endopeptidase MepM/ murein hydrolase activator NlpD
VEKVFLRSPVEFSYISSKYNLKRKHPILNRIKAHTGVDYAAPTGTPVRATGSGTVSFRGNNGGYGKLIEIKHSEDYSTRYAHLSRYKKGIQVGSKVKQGEVIGYVGRTGRATGPHLHYEFRVNGMHTNPLTVKLPAAKPINELEKDSFFKTAIDAMNKMDDFYLMLYAGSD